MSIYLDASVLVSYLYEETDQPAKSAAAKRLINAIVEHRVEMLVSFYALPELYGYVAANYAEDKINETFRTSLVELFSLPLTVKPFVERTAMEQLRQQFSISDPSDVAHVVAALFYECDTIITFDHHFQQVASLIPVHTPAEFLATLQDAS